MKISTITTALALLAGAHDPTVHSKPGDGPAPGLAHRSSRRRCPRVGRERPLAAPDAFAPALRRHHGDLLATWIEPGAGAGPARSVPLRRHRAGRWSRPTTVRSRASCSPTGLTRRASPLRPTAGSTSGGWRNRQRQPTPTTFGSRARATAATFRPLGMVNEDRSPVEHGFVSAIAEGDGLRLFFLDGRATGGGRPMRLRTASSPAIGSKQRDSWTARSATAARRRRLQLPMAPPWRIATARAGRSATSRRASQAPGGSSAISTVPVAADRWQIEGCPVNGPAMAAGLDGGERVAVAWYRRRTSVRASRWRSRTTAAGALAQRSARRRAPRTDAVAAVPSGFVVAWFARTGNGAALRVAPVDFGGNVANASTVALVDAGRRSGLPRLETVRRDPLAGLDEPGRPRPPASPRSPRSRSAEPTLSRSGRSRGRSARTRRRPHRAGHDQPGVRDPRLEARRKLGGRARPVSPHSELKSSSPATSRTSRR